MAVSFEELNDSPEENFGTGGMRATRRFLVDWADRYDFIMELAGVGETGGGGPIQYPGFPEVICQSAKIRRFNDLLDTTASPPTLETQVNTYVGKALVTAEYEYVGYSWPGADEQPIQEDTFLTVRRTAGAEGVVHKAEHFLFGGVEADDPELHFLQRVPIGEYHFMWHRVANPPWLTIDDYTGLVNETAWHGRAAETLLFDSYTAEVGFVRLDTGAVVQPLWTITYVMRERRVRENAGAIGGWNHVYKTKKGERGWTRITDEDGNPPYRTTDIRVAGGNFNELFYYEGQ